MSRTTQHATATREQRASAAHFSTCRHAGVHRLAVLLAIAACALLSAGNAAAEPVHYWSWDGVDTDFGSNPVTGALAGGAVYDTTVFAPTAGNAGLAT